LFWQYATPVAYSSSLIPTKWRLLYGLNPMTGVVEGFRWALLGTGDVGGLLWVSVIIIILLLVSGLVYFKRMETSFADVI
jgi:lipopolysaccharide transport system permease protein